MRAANGVFSSLQKWVFEKVHKIAAQPLSDRMSVSVSTRKTLLQAKWHSARVRGGHGICPTTLDREKIWIKTRVEHHGLLSAVYSVASEKIISVIIVGIEILPTLPCKFQPSSMFLSKDTYSAEEWTFDREKRSKTQISYNHWTFPETSSSEGWNLKNGSLATKAASGTNFTAINCASDFGACLAI